MNIYLIKRFLKSFLKFFSYKIRRIFRDINSTLKFFLLCLIILAIIRGVVNGY